MRGRNFFGLLIIVVSLLAWGCTIEVESAYDAKAAGGASSGSASGNGGGDDGGGATEGTGGDGGTTGDTMTYDDADGGGGDDWRWEGPWEPYEDEELIERGDMLVNHVAGCIQCHTKVKDDGTFDKTRFLAGKERLFDLAPEVEDVGGINVANITPSEPGIRDFTPEKFQQAVTEGYYENEEGDRYIMAPIMPFWSFNNLKEEDLNAITAYVRSIDPVDLNIPEREDLPEPFDNWDRRTEPIEPVPLEMQPETTLNEGDPNYEKAKEGKYWAAIGLCVDCHTPFVPPIPPDGWDPAPMSEGGDGPNYPYRAVAEEQILRGGKRFPTEIMMGLPVPPWPEFVYSRNLTSGEGGIGQYGPDQIVEELKTGVDAEDRPMCPPMPAGPGGFFQEMPRNIKEAAAHYVTSIPGRPSNDLPNVEGDEIPNCTPPGE